MRKSGVPGGSHRVAVRPHGLAAVTLGLQTTAAGIVERLPILAGGYA